MLFPASISTPTASERRMAKRAAHKSSASRWEAIALGRVDSPDSGMIPRGIISRTLTRQCDSNHIAGHGRELGAHFSCGSEERGFWMNTYARGQNNRGLEKGFEPQRGRDSQKLKAPLLATTGEVGQKIWASVYGETVIVAVLLVTVPMVAVIVTVPPCPVERPAAIVT